VKTNDACPTYKNNKNHKLICYFYMSLGHAVFLEQRVREALEPPPLERAKRAEVNSKERKSCQTLNELNSHIVFGLTGTNRDVLKSRKWRALQAKRQVQRLMRMNYIQPFPFLNYFHVQY
jgi:hypothetical protein